MTGFGINGSCRRTKADMTPHDAIKARKVGHNRVLLDYPNGNRAFRLHLTDVVTRCPDGSTILYDGGFPTITTRKAMNEGLDFFGVPSHGRVYSGSPNSAHCYGGNHFHSKLTILPNGGIESDYTESESARIKALKAKIKAFASRIYKLDAVPLPDGGDCWLCHMVYAETKKPWGSDNTEHLASHLEENYLHGSLILNAMRASGFNDTGIGIYWQMANGKDPKYARSVMVRAVRKYLSRQFGLPA